ncbi:MAG: RNA polymerase subunit sigma-70 [Natrialbaceae archaeon]|nr:RNA polymerase subunit sigma-70 [Natrialbaceae archaeon]
MYEVLSEPAAQVILTLEPGDSIRRVAQRLQTPYETVRQAVNRLEDAGYVRYDDGLAVTDERVREAALEFVAASARVCPPTIEEAYVLPHYGDWPFAFTRIDAVFVWTRGGYQVSRGPEDYPLFIAVLEDDIDDWQRFFESFDQPTAFDRQPTEEITGSLQWVLEPRESLEIDEVDGYPVVPRAETIDYMRENVTQFQSGLAMLDRMYENLDLGVTYQETDFAQP